MDTRTFSAVGKRAGRLPWRRAAVHPRRSPWPRTAHAPHVVLPCTGTCVWPCQQLGKWVPLWVSLSPQVSLVRVYLCVCPCALRLCLPAARGSARAPEKHRSTRVRRKEPKSSDRRAVCHQPGCTWGKIFTYASARAPFVAPRAASRVCQRLSS